MYRAMYKSELAQAAGVSQRTFSRYVQLQQAELKKLGVTPQTRLLPPKAVKLLCDNLCIEIWKKLLPIPEFSGMGSNFFQSRVGENSFAAGVLHIGEG